MNKKTRTILVGLVALFLLLLFVVFANTPPHTKTVPPPTATDPVFPDRAQTVTDPDALPGTTTVPGSEVTAGTLHDDRIARKILARVQEDEWENHDPVIQTYALEGDGWTMEYQHGFNQFSIGITGTPGEEKQRAAEAALLEAVDMPETEVCKLGVQVFWDNWDTQFEMMNTTLTFCTSSN